VILVPVCPTCWVCGRHPSDVTTRETPTTPPSSDASSSSGAKPSALPTPRPPPTTTRAVASDAPPAPAGASSARTIMSAPSSDGVTSCTATSPGTAPIDTASAGTASAGTAATASTATVSSAAGASRTDSSSSSPAQRCRTSERPVPESAALAETQFAAIGSPVIAPRCASTSFPWSVPAATTTGTLPPS
jgi:hypothetical protein